MPNWCHNTLTVSGAGVAEFAEKVRTEEQPLSFAAHLPIPEGEDWYGWCIGNWGTKWDAKFDGAFVAAIASEEAAEADLDAQTGVATIADGLVIYKFTTAWGPPTEWLGAVSEMEPELEFKLTYAEPGSDFAGEAIAVAGQLEDTQLNVDEVLSPEEMWF